MGWGGKRKRAGAPKGNLNAYKHGRTSKQHQRLVEIIAADPEATRLTIHLSRRKNRRHNRDNERAKQLLDHLKRLAEAAALKRAKINSGDDAPSDTRVDETK